MSTENGLLISDQQLVERRIVTQQALQQFPTEVVDKHGSLARMASMSREGLGFMVASNHFCRDDFKRTLAILLSKEALARKRVAIAIGLHEFPTYEPFAVAAGIDTYPVTTQGTINTLGHKAPPLGTGMEEFMGAAIETLKRGNLVIMAPQGGRRPRMTRSEGRILQTLFGDAEDEGVEFGVLFSGIGIKGQGDYTNRDYHYGEKFILRFGKVYTSTELISAIEGNSDSQRLRRVDAFWEEQTMLLVPQEYR